MISKGNSFALGFVVMLMIGVAYGILPIVETFINSFQIW